MSAAKEMNVSGSRYHGRSLLKVALQVRQVQAPLAAVRDQRVSTGFV